jgi:hypothetical protein
LNFIDGLFEKYSKIKFHGNSASGAESSHAGGRAGGRKDERTDIHDESNSFFFKFCERI